jgi:hypothetical protein
MIRKGTFMSASRFGSPNSEQLLEGIRNFFEPQLVRLGLSESQIDSYILEDLKVYLETIDKAIDHPESFGVLRLSFNAEAGAIIVKQDSSSHIEFGILPILLERRTRIINRIRHLEFEADLSNLEEEIAKSQTDPTKLKSLEEELEEKKLEEARLGEDRLRDQQVPTAAGKSRESSGEVNPLNRNDQLLFQVELQERKTAIRQSWFARESVASLVGGLLLLALATTMIVAMFSDTAVSQIVSNAFLVILGYFFGQAVRERVEESTSATGGAK